MCSWFQQVYYGQHVFIHWVYWTIYESLTWSSKRECYTFFGFEVGCIPLLHKSFFWLNSSLLFKFFLSFSFLTFERQMSDYDWEHYHIKACCICVIQLVRTMSVFPLKIFITSRLDKWTNSIIYPKLCQICFFEILLVLRTSSFLFGLDILCKGELINHNPQIIACSLVCIRPLFEWFELTFSLITFYPHFLVTFLPAGF